jgi:hypothetical protein
MRSILDFILHERGLNPDGATDATIRTERNLEALASLRNSDANSKHIEKRILKRHEANRLVHVMLRNIRSDKQTAMTTIELYLDDWVFNNGPITRENYAEAIADCVDRVVKQAEARQRLREEAEFKELQGMEDYPL